MQEVVDLVNHWAAYPARSRLVTFTNVHMVVEASQHRDFRHVLNQMDLNCPDGFPIFWLTRQHLGKHVQKVSGPDFMEIFCEQSVALGHRHFFYGGLPGVSREASAALERRFPGIQIAGHYSPPFRALNQQEIRAIVHRIEESGANLVWVCLGCPKQERWIAEMRDRLPGKVILAVGQAFDVISGRTQRAPRFLVKHGGEWAYRLVKEPRRLWKRYLVMNTYFLALIAWNKLAEQQRMVQQQGLVRQQAQDED